MSRAATYGALFVLRVPSRVATTTQQRQFFAPTLKRMVKSPSAYIHNLPTHFIVRQRHQQRLYSSTPVNERSSNHNNNDDDDDEIPYHPDFLPGTKVQVEVVDFGPLGASVDVIALSHKVDDLIPVGAVPLAKGIILQSEINYFRLARHNIDVVRGEVLPAYVERVRAFLEDGTPRVDVSLRVYGGKAKAKEIGQQIMERLQNDGEIPIGDKSSPEEVARQFPGVSKIAFKRAVAALYKQGKAEPGPHKTRLYKP